MFCKNCGAELADGTKFCGACGTDQTAPSQPQAAPSAPAAPTDFVALIRKNMKYIVLGIAVFALILSIMNL